MDRKAKIREYKTRPTPLGVYQIRNTANGKLLIGSASNVPAMLNRHKAQLRLGVHSNVQLQSDWNTLGPAAFVFETLDLLTPPADPAYDPSADLDVLQAMWLEKLSPFGDRGYNRPPRAT